MSSNKYSSIRRAMSSSSYSRRTSLSTAPTAFPQPPTTRPKRPKMTVPTEDRRSIRVVPSSTRSSLIDRRTLQAKRQSYIKKRASAPSPFFSAGYRASSSTHPSPVQSPIHSKHSTARASTIVKPDDDVVEGRGKEIPKEKRVGKYPGSLRKHRSSRTLASSTSSKGATDRESVSQNWAPAVPSAAPTVSMNSRASSRRSLRASELKSSLNDLTGAEIYDDAELSESVYTDEEDDIEDYQRRTTIKSGNFVLPPLNFNAITSQLQEQRKSKRESNSNNSKKSKDMKRTSEREATPHHLAHEHGGKENLSSTYTTGKTQPISKIPPTIIKPTALTERPKAALATRYSQTRPISRVPTSRSSQVLPLHPSKERNSRKSAPSRPQSRMSGSRPSMPGGRPSMSGSRQSMPTSRQTSYSYSPRPQQQQQQYTPNYPLASTPRASQDSSVIGAALSTPARQSSAYRSLSGMSSFYSDNDSTVFDSASAVAAAQRAQRARQSVGLGLFPASPGSVVGSPVRERSPLSIVVCDESTGEGAHEGGVSGEKRRVWGASWKSVVGRGSVWGGDKEAKAFL
jgi:hypothetical protein